jgi:hypothetical protein
LTEDEKDVDADLSSFNDGNETSNDVDNLNQIFVAFRQNIAFPKYKMSILFNIKQHFGLHRIVNHRLLLLLASTSTTGRRLGYPNGLYHYGRNPNGMQWYIWGMKLQNWWHQNFGIVHLYNVIITGLDMDDTKSITTTATMSSTAALKQKHQQNNNSSQQQHPTTTATQIV